MAPENLHVAPAATVSDPAVPDEILKKIGYGWVAAVCSASLTLVVTLMAMSGTEILGFSALELFDVALVFGLAFGIYKKSRTCAVLMLVYFLASKIIVMAEIGRPTGIPMALAFAYFLWQGVSGTFAYHEFKEHYFAPSAGRD